MNFEQTWYDNLTNTLSLKLNIINVLDYITGEYGFKWGDI